MNSSGATVADGAAHNPHPRWGGDACVALGGDNMRRPREGKRASSLQSFVAWEPWYRPLVELQAS